MMAIRVASIVRLKKIILFRINHFGIKPVSGGRPPRDKIDSVRADVSCGVVVHIVPRSLIVVEDVEWSIRKIGMVVSM